MGAEQRLRRRDSRGPQSGEETGCARLHPTSRACAPTGEPMISRIFMWCLLALASSAALAATPGNLDELLEQTRSARQREAQANEEREKRFVAERNKQAELVSGARAALAAERQRGTTLASTYDANEKRLA